MKLLQIRKILSVALVVCIISGNSVNVSAAEHTGPEEIIDQTESLSEEEESTGPSSEETAENQRTRKTGQAICLPPAKIHPCQKKEMTQRRM